MEVVTCVGISSEPGGRDCEGTVCCMVAWFVASVFMSRQSVVSVFMSRQSVKHAPKVT